MLQCERGGVHGKHQTPPPPTLWLSGIGFLTVRSSASAGSVWFFALLMSFPRRRALGWLFLTRCLLSYSRASSFWMNSGNCYVNVAQKRLPKFIWNLDTGLRSVKCLRVSPVFFYYFFFMAIWKQSLRKSEWKKSEIKDRRKLKSTKMFRGKCYGTEKENKRAKSEAWAYLVLPILEHLDGNTYHSVALLLLDNLIEWHTRALAHVQPVNTCRFACSSAVGKGIGNSLVLSHS